MSHTEYSAQFVQYSSVFLGLEEAPSQQLEQSYTLRWIGVRRGRTS
jgi:hypothetical protein